MTGTQECKDLLVAEVVRLRADLEVERMRLAACGVAAHGAPVSQFEGLPPEYGSDALTATRALVADNERLHAAMGEANADQEQLLDALNRLRAEYEAQCAHTAKVADRCAEVSAQLREAAEAFVNGVWTPEAARKLRAVLAKVRP